MDGDAFVAFEGDCGARFQLVTYLPNLKLSLNFFFSSRLYYYYYVKTEGVKFLRDSLGIAEDNIVPLTFKKTNRNFESREDREGREDRPRGRGRGRGRGGDRGGRRGRGRGG